MKNAESTLKIELRHDTICKAHHCREEFGTTKGKALQL